MLPSNSDYCFIFIRAYFVLEALRLCAYKSTIDIDIVQFMSWCIVPILSCILHADVE